MNIESFLLMRQEILLAILALVILIADFVVTDNKHKLISFSILLFAIVTFLGFLPLSEGNLFGGMYQTSNTQWMMKNILNIGVLIIFLLSATWLKNPENKNSISEFFIIMIFSLIGMDYMISSGNFLMMYLGLELATIPVAALAAFDRFSLKSAEAGIKLIISSALSSAVLLFGLSLIYGSTGSLYYSEITVAIFENNILQSLAFVLFFTGMAFKLSLVPFHLWTADVYEGAPIGVTSFLSVISKAAAAFILVILLFTVFNSLVELWKPLLYTLAITTMTIGNLFALRQQNLKRFLAFSSIAQAGFILLGLLGADSNGMTSIIYFLLIYVFSNLAAFGVVSTIFDKTGKLNMDEYNGFHSTNPMLTWVMTLALFSLAGIPPVAGFFGKFFLFTSAASAGYYWLVFIAVLNATISLYYYLLIVKAMFINKSENPISYFKSDGFTRIALIICVIGIFVVGLYSGFYHMISDISFGM